MSGKTSVISKGNGRVDVRKLTTMAMLAAIGVMLVAFIEVPIIPAAPFLKYDPADVPILIGTLVYGPVAGLILTVVVSFIQSFMLHGSGGIIGFIMHVIATGAMVLVAGSLYTWIKRSAETKLASDSTIENAIYCKKKPSTMTWAAVSLAAGTIAMTVAMMGMNLVLTPIFMGTPVDAVIKLMLPAIVPFNLIKAGLNSVAAFLVYKFVEKVAL